MIMRKFLSNLINMKLLYFYFTINVGCFAMELPNSTESPDVNNKRVITFLCALNRNALDNPVFKLPLELTIKIISQMPEEINSLKLLAAILPSISLEQLSYFLIAIPFNILNIALGKTDSDNVLKYKIEYYIEDKLRIVINKNLLSKSLVPTIDSYITQLNKTKPADATCAIQHLNKIKKDIVEVESLNHDIAVTPMYAHTRLNLNSRLLQISQNLLSKTKAIKTKVD